MTTSPLMLVVGLNTYRSKPMGLMLQGSGVHLTHHLTHEVNALEEDLLINLDRWWVSPRGMEPLPRGWVGSVHADRALKRLIQLLQPESTRQQAPWAIEAPLSGLILPLWRATCHQLCIPLRLVLAVASPRNAMVELVNRYAQVSGMDEWRAQRLWWHLNTQVLRQGRGLSLEVIRLDNAGKPIVGLEQLRRLTLHSPDQARQKNIREIAPEQRNNKRQTLSTRLSLPVQELDRRLQRLAIQPSTRHELDQWLNQRNDPKALAPLPRRRSELKRRFNTWRGQPAINRVATHPWGYLAQLMCGSQGPEAEHLLTFWLTHGFRDFELERFSALPGPTPDAQAWCGTQHTVMLQVRGGDLDSWPTHALLQHCPVQGECRITALAYGATEESGLLLNLAGLDLQPGQPCSEKLLQWARLKRVWDPDPERVRVLRQFGINASVLHLHQYINSYLLPTQNSWDCCAELLGLPSPQQLTSLGTTVCLGTNGPQLDGQLEGPLLGIPGFTGLKITTPEHAYLLGIWLQGCLHAGLELVVFTSVASQEVRQCWNLLVQRKSPGLAPILLLDQHNPMKPQELLDELNWYRAGCPMPQPCSTPSPQHQTLFHRENSKPCAQAVCISLFNYGARIQIALNSVLAQRQAHELELIVVDDASIDDSAGVVQTWMAEHHQHFRRCLLLQHTSNGGLASARNTAFAAAKSPWCFVLDADNQLNPLALSHCGALAMSADARCAVVHSLVRVSAEESAKEERYLVSDLPWQKEVFERGNYIDAMALVRRNAWQAVGGYTHIPGGWEDFDFWCSLIDGGWHGILCPQVLATYTSHGNSMRATNTTHQERRLSRLLQTRHPWLQLPLAQNCGVWSNISEEVSL